MTLKFQMLICDKDIKLVSPLDFMFYKNKISLG